MNDISKFEQIGTHPQAIRAAVGEALAFHQAIGAERKAARLRYLTLRWANAIKSHPRVKMFSSLEPGQTWGLAMVGIDGIDPTALAQHLRDKYRIVVNARFGGALPNPVYDFKGLRVTPNVYTTIEEIDTFAQAMLDVAKKGLPPAAPAARDTGGERGWIGDSPFIFLDCGKIRGLGWAPKTSIRDGVIGTLRYLQENPWLLEARA
jgi:nucleoside-diphosphate-sugar epimerase